MEVVHQRQWMSERESMLSPVSHSNKYRTALSYHNQPKPTFIPPKRSSHHKKITKSPLNDHRSSLNHSDYFEPTQKVTWISSRTHTEIRWWFSSLDCHVASSISSEYQFGTETSCTHWLTGTVPLRSSSSSSPLPSHRSTCVAHHRWFAELAPAGKRHFVSVAGCPFAVPSTNWSKLVKRMRQTNIRGNVACRSQCHWECHCLRGTLFCRTWFCIWKIPETIELHKWRWLCFEIRCRRIWWEGGCLRRVWGIWLIPFVKKIEFIWR